MGLALWVEFFDELQNIRGRSLNTVMAYRRDLELYAEFLTKNTDLSALGSFLSDRGLSGRSQARVMSSLRTYFKFLEENGRSVPELRVLRSPRVEVGLPKPISLGEFEKLMKACVVEDPAKTHRNQLTLILLFGIGCRVSELIGLNLMDVHPTEGTVRVLGKGQKERLIPLSQFVLNEVRRYLDSTRPLLVQDTRERSLLINDRRSRPSRVDIWRWLAAWSARSGFEEPIGPHRFRHGCATNLLEAGADLRAIQILLGHASLQTTQIYTSVTTDRLSAVVAEHHPLSGLEKSSLVKDT